MNGTATPAPPQPFRRYDPALHNHRVYLHCDPRTGLIVPTPTTSR